MSLFYAGTDVRNRQEVYLDLDHLITLTREELDERTVRVVAVVRNDWREPAQYIFLNDDAERLWAEERKRHERNKPDLSARDYPIRYKKKPTDIQTDANEQTDVTVG